MWRILRGCFATRLASFVPPQLLGDAGAMIVCFGIDPLDEDCAAYQLSIYEVVDELKSAADWSLNALQSPPCVHLCCTCCHVGKEEDFLLDLQRAVSACLEKAKREIEDDGRGRAGAGPSGVGKGWMGGKVRRRKPSGRAAVYGMSGSLPAAPVSELLKTYNDVILDL